MRFFLLFCIAHLAAFEVDIPFRIAIPEMHSLHVLSQYPYMLAEYSSTQDKAVLNAYTSLDIELVHNGKEENSKLIAKFLPNPALKERGRFSLGIDTTTTLHTVDISDGNWVDVLQRITRGRTAEKLILSFEYEVASLQTEQELHIGHIALQFNDM